MQIEREYNLYYIITGVVKRFYVRKSFQHTISFHLEWFILEQKRMNETLEMTGSNQTIYYY